MTERNEHAGQRDIHFERDDSMSAAPSGIWSIEPGLDDSALAGIVALAVHRDLLSRPTRGSRTLRALR